MTLTIWVNQHPKTTYLDSQTWKIFSSVSVTVINLSCCCFSLSCRWESLNWGWASLHKKAGHFWPFCFSSQMSRFEPLSQLQLSVKFDFIFSVWQKVYFHEENNFTLLIIIHHNKIHLIEQQSLFLTKILFFHYSSLPSATFLYFQQTNDMMVFSSPTQIKVNLITQILDQQPLLRFLNCSLMMSCE